MQDSNTTIQDLKKHVYQFIDERDWRQFHGAKNMSMNISIEAAELMELFRWAQNKQEADTIVNHKKETVENELADVLFSIIAFADEYNIDLAQAVEHKMELNRKKYPTELCKGLNKKYNEY